MRDRKLTALLLIPTVWEVMCLPRFTGYGMLLGAAGAYLLQMLLLLPFADGRVMLRSRWIKRLFALGFLFFGVRSLTQLCTVAPRELLAVPGTWGAVGLLLVTCLVTARMGLRAAARCAPVVMGGFVIGLVLLTFGAWGHIETGRMTLEGLQDGFGMFFLSPELPALWVLGMRENRSVRRDLIALTIGKTAIFCAVGFLCLSAGGVLTAQSDAPFFTLCALSQPMQGQRADALYILLFVTVCVMQVTMMMTIAFRLGDSALLGMNNEQLTINS